MLATAGAMTVTVVAVVAARPHGEDDTEVWREFHDRVAAYATLRDRLASSLPPLRGDAPSIAARRSALSSAMKRARPRAGQGDVFTPEVALRFRETVADALRHLDVEAMLRALFAEHPAPRGRLRVYDPYPDWATHEVPAILLQRLPALPDGIMYRLVNHDLLLWDADANLIVDILPGALARSAFSAHHTWSASEGRR
jgi:hypothetical protein